MLGMSATEVAKEIGVSVSAVTKWLRSGRITRTHLVDFSFRYNINLEWLMTGIGSMRHHSKDDPTVNTVPIYPLGQIRCRNNLPTCADESLSVGRVWVQGDTARHFGIEVNCPEVDPRLRPGRHFVF